MRSRGRGIFRLPLAREAHFFPGSGQDFRFTKHPHSPGLS